MKNYFPKCQLPDTLEILECMINRDDVDLPKSLTELNIKGHDDVSKPIFGINNFVITLPQYIKILALGTMIETFIPSSVTNLHLDKYNTPLRGAFENVTK